MTFLDFSSALDTVDQNILIRRLKTEYGVEGIALNGFKSYLVIEVIKLKLNIRSQMLNYLHLGLLRAQYLDLFYTHYMLKI